MHNRLFRLLRRIKNRAGHPDAGKTQPHLSLGYSQQDLGLADSEHLGATYGTGALSRWFAILHGYTLRILHLPLSAALYTISLHLLPPL